MSVNQSKFKRTQIAALSAVGLFDLIVPNWREAVWNELRHTIKRLVHPRHRRECLAAADECEAEAKHKPKRKQSANQVQE